MLKHQSSLCPGISFSSLLLGNHVNRVTGREGSPIRELNAILGEGGVTRGGLEADPAGCLIIFI